jgi:3-hydroxyisobutyrate dehydrogenase-like beta-hydroxyacid dehydrogenase|tara:strand:- start:6719 stop:7564 length:846 start_codon:yes stop_codon:yes gene_type:complete
MSKTIGLINPGAMGASVGAAAAGTGNRVLWASADRSDATRERAGRAGLEDCDTLQQLVLQSDCILSVCPPHAAEAVAEEVTATGFSGTYLEGNAISPKRTGKIEQLILSAGGRFVDGGIIGGPAWRQESNTRLYLSGEHAPDIATYFTASPLEAIVISDRVGAASALKMTFAAYTKGSTALLSAILAVAEQAGVRADLERQWGDSFTEQTRNRVAGNTAKAWRFAGEMREISATFADAGVPGDFHEGAAKIFQRLSQFKDRAEVPAIDEVLDALLKPQNTS